VSGVYRPSARQLQWLFERLSLQRLSAVREMRRRARTSSRLLVTVLGANLVLPALAGVD